MRVAVIGADAAKLCRASGTSAAVFPSLCAAPDCLWTLLALTRDAAKLFPLRAQSLLLPGDCPAALARHADQVIGYGFSPRDTLTLSSTQDGRLLCLQRSVITLGGRVIEPQELPLPDGFNTLSDEDAMLAALLRLLCDS